MGLLIDRGVSDEFGARELKRTLHRQLMQPIAAMVAEGRVPPQSTVHADVGPNEALRLRVTRKPVRLRLVS